jgi:glyoxylase-like metal-dependent hydrolase (beta-lactamase superfamily II)
VQQWKIGDVVVTKVVETIQDITLAGLLPAAQPDALAAHLDWLVPHYLAADGTLRLSIHALVVESQGRRLCVDTCLGDRAIPGFDTLRGDPEFLDRLADAGHAADSIDVVVCTHLHFDHVGWNTRWDGSAWLPTFPNARYLFARPEYEHWRSESNPLVGTLHDATAAVFEAGLADLVEPDHAVTSEVRLVPTPGHSPGHVSVLIESRGERALITGDATHHPVQWAEPHWTSVADWDGEMSTATRRAMLDEHLDAGTLVIGTHYPEPSAGRLVTEPGGVRFRP